MLTQEQQDRLWSHYQNEGVGSFDASYARLRFFAETSVAGTRVLNIGIGSGVMEELMQKRGVDVHAMDPDPRTVEQLQRRLVNAEKVRQGHVESIPFDSGHFDRVVMTEVLEHLSVSALHAALGEVRRVLRKGGEFVGTVPYREDLDTGNVVCPECNCRFHRWGHQQSFDKKTLGTELTEAGFRVVHLYPRAFPDFRRTGARAFLKSVFRYVLGRLGEPLIAPNLYFVAKRDQGD